MSTVAERVAWGVAWLDERRPGWATVVDLDRLDLGNCCQCVIGQLIGCYLSAANTIGADEASSLGFLASGHDTHALYRIEVLELRSEWRRVITERRAAA